MPLRLSATPRRGVAHSMTFYNQLKPHRALDGPTLDRVDCDNVPARPTAP